MRILYASVRQWIRTTGDFFTATTPEHEISFHKIAIFLHDTSDTDPNKKTMKLFQNGL